MMLAAALQLPPAICALLAVATTMIVTGALHEDGLADTADGLFGGYTRERRLEIMKDSRIGTFGAAALVFSIALRAAALAAIGLSWAAMLALVAAHMASRAVLPALLHATRPAKPEGLAASVGAVSRETAIVALAIGAVALLPLGILAAVQATFALALIFAAVRQAANQRIGGVTGDIVGALQQLCEIAALCAAAAAFT
jgi:adenosylcobinamide-GDP ribazoletransferase